MLQHSMNGADVATFYQRMIFLLYMRCSLPIILVSFLDDRQGGISLRRHLHMKGSMFVSTKTKNQSRHFTVLLKGGGK